MQIFYYLRSSVKKKHELIFHHVLLYWIEYDRLLVSLIIRVSLMCLGVGSFVNTSFLPQCFFDVFSNFILSSFSSPSLTSFFRSTPILEGVFWSCHKTNHNLIFLLERIRWKYHGGVISDEKSLFRTCFTSRLSPATWFIRGSFQLNLLASPISHRSR